MNRKLTCIICPKGCRITVFGDDKLEVSGNSCSRGIEYGIKEVTSPTRVVTSTVEIYGAAQRQMPVKTSRDIPKGKIFECMGIINNIKVTAPIKCGDVIVKNIFDSGADIVATKTMGKV